MLFNTIDFIIFFALILTTIIIYKNRNFQYFFLIIASYVFFYYSNNFLITLIIFSTILDFYIAKKIYESRDITYKKKLLAISIVGNLGLLAFFKYTNFAISQFNNLFEIFGFEKIQFLEIILPIGISFYTFQILSYTIDVYRGNLSPSKSFKEFALFVVFFPQLVAGPILRASHFLPQLREKFSANWNSTEIKHALVKNSNLKIGITLMAFGFFKKMFFADNIAPFVDQIFQNPIGHESYVIILGAIGFGIQLYCDFSGYSDIAIGIALILGFQIPKNFNFPFFANSPAEFWRRWHISLSNWVRDYVFFPLVIGKKNSIFRIVSSIFVTMFLIGIWHGAGINFIIYGLIHGIYVGTETFFKSKFPSLKNKALFKSLPVKIFSILFTQYLIFLSFLSFRIQDLDHLTYSMNKFVFFDFNFNGFNEFLLDNKLGIFLIILFIIIHIIAFKRKNILEIISNLKLRYWTIFLISLMVLILFFFDSNPRDFIYFRF